MNAIVTAPPAIPPELTGGRFKAIAIGRDDAVLIHQDGTLEAVTLKPALKSVPTGSYNAVTVGSGFAVAIKEDETLKAWGLDGPPSDPSITGLLNAPEGGSFKQVEASVFYSLALHEDGTLYGWGRPANGVYVLDGWTKAPEDPANFFRPGETYKAIAAGNAHALAILPDGRVTGWGDNAGGALQAPTHLRFKAVAAGWGFSIGLQTDGTLWGWGTPKALPPISQGWTFASQDWTQYGNTGQYFVEGERFNLISAAAFHVMAVTAGN